MPHATDSFTLADGHTVAFHQRSNRWVQVTQGRLWITCSHDPVDHFVEAGGRLRIGPGHVVLQADAGPARYRLAPQIQHRAGSSGQAPAVTAPCRGSAGPAGPAPA